ncbi:GNAT family N-acetyltransferase [Gillisia sp. Q332]|uniref:GNAT family N-acetyltransferase n=1 Tax=Gillisia xinjiangensis TaxID=3384765 RepID=UPI0039195379
MKIEHTKTEKKGHFDAVSKNGKAGTMTYTWTGESRITIEHTEVYTEFEGEGIGKKLVCEAVEFARQENLKIIPECSYANHVLQSDDTFSDVLI